MKKRFAALLAATAIVGVTTAFAANPFSDVTPNDWAYQAVSQLAAAGVVNGYPDGTFKGQNNITRYEMAQMVAKAMANQNRANAEQQAMINRLADEFSSELNNLGVRVGKLEKQVGALTYSGDARIRYYYGANNVADGTPNTWDYRVRLQFENEVNKNTTVTARIAYEDEFGRTGDDDGHGTGQASIDAAFVTHKFGNAASLEAGRTNLFVGQGLLYDDTFDGAIAKVSVGEALTFTGAYGYPIEGGTSVFDFSANRADKPVVLGQIDGALGKHVAATAFYLKGTKMAADIKAYGFGLTTTFNKLQVSGEWTKDRSVDHSSAWTAHVGYGDYDLGEKGTWDIGVRYFNQDKNSAVISSTYNQPLNNNYKTWAATANYALAKNVGLGVEYYFSGKDQDNNKVDNFIYTQLEYKF